MIYFEGITLRRVMRDSFYHDSDGNRRRIRSDMVEVVAHQNGKEKILIRDCHDSQLHHWVNVVVIDHLNIVNDNKDSEL